MTLLNNAADVFADNFNGKATLYDHQKRLKAPEIAVGEQVHLTESFFVGEEVKHHALNHIKKIIVNNMSDAQEKAAKLLQNAKLEAKTCLENAKHEAERIYTEEGIGQRDRILEEAYHTGFEAGKENGSQTIQTELNLSHDLLRQAKAQYQNELAKAEQSVISMAKQLATHLIQKQFNEDESSLSDYLKTALANIALDTSTKTIVYLSHNALEKLHTAYQGLQQFGDIQFQIDDRCANGKLYVENKHLIHDISPEAQLEKLLAQITTATSQPEQQTHDVSTRCLS